MGGVNGRGKSSRGGVSYIDTANGTDRRGADYATTI